VLPVLFSRFTTPPLPVVGVLGHAIDQAAAEKGWLIWGNYEAVSRLFPVRFRPTAGSVDLYAIEALPDSLDLASYKDRTDYVFTWKMEPGSPFDRRLRRYFQLVAEDGSGRVYARREGRKPAKRAEGAAQRP